MTHNVTLKGLNHVAWRCIDAEETRHFYEDILGLPLAHTVRGDKVPSTGEPVPHFHIFFEMGDGSYVAFFDIKDGLGATVSADTPSWVHHFAFEVASVADVVAMKGRLEQAGIDVLGITDHHFINSIYFFDPNGLRLEVTARTEGKAYMDQAKLRAHASLREWTEQKRAAATA